MIIIERKDGMDEDSVMMDALEAGAEDVISSEDNFEIRTEPSLFNEVHKAITEAGYEIVEAEIEHIPAMEAQIDENDVKALSKLIDTLEDNDDVQNVYHNWEIPEDLDVE